MAVEITPPEVAQPVTGSHRGISVTTSGGTMEQLAQAVKENAGSLLPKAEKVDPPVASVEADGEGQNQSGADHGAAAALHPESAEATEGSTEAPPEKHKDLRKRLAKQAADKAEIEAERDRLKRENDELRARATPAAQTQASPSANGDATFPAYDAYLVTHPNETYEQYLDARTDHRWQVKEAARQAEEAKTRAEQQRTDAQRRFETQKAEIDDFDDVVDLETPLLTQLMYDTAIDSPIAAKVIYALAKNPAEAQRIAQLSPREQVREMGILEGTLRASAPGSSARPMQSRAPRPIQPGGGSATPASSESFLESAARIGSQTAGTLRQYESLRTAHGMNGRRR